VGGHPASTPISAKQISLSQDVLALVQNSLRESRSHVRRNAIVALGAIANQEADRALAERGINELVRIAVASEEASVQRWAVEEILGLPEHVRDRVAGRVYPALERPEERARAYSLLGLLQNRRTRIELRRLPWRTRARIAREAAPLLDPARSGAYRFDLAVPAVLGTVVGVAMLVGFLAGVPGFEAGNVDGSLIVVLLLSLAAAPILAVLASRWMNPIGLQPDRPLAVSTEVLGAVRGAWLPAFLLIVILVTLRLPGQTVEWAAVAVAWVLIAVQPAAVRLGTLVGAGLRLPVAGRFVGSFVDRLLPAATGSAAGAVFLTLAVVVPYLLAGWQPTQGMTLPAGLWLALLPGCLGLGWAFARLDARSPALRRPLLGAGAIPATLLLLTLVAIPAAILLGPGSPTIAAVDDRAIRAQADTTIAWSVDAVPFVRTIELRPGPGRRVGVYAAAPHSDVYPEDLVVEIFEAHTGSLLGSADDPPEAQTVLGTGTFGVRVLKFSQYVSAAGGPVLAPSIVLPLLVSRLLPGRSQVLVAGSGDDGNELRALEPFQLVVELSADTARMLGRRQVADVIEMVRLGIDGPEVVDSAIVAVQAAERRWPGVVLPAQYSRLCLHSVSLHPERARDVSFACDAALAADGSNPSYRLGRGIVEGLIGDADRAIQDVEAYLDSPGRGEAAVRLYREWIDILRTRRLTADDVRRR
jgi:hypothetical protein